MTWKLSSTWTHFHHQFSNSPKVVVIPEITRYFLMLIRVHFLYKIRSNQIITQLWTTHLGISISREIIIEEWIQIIMSRKTCSKIHNLLTLWSKISELKMRSRGQMEVTRSKFMTFSEFRLKIIRPRGTRIPPWVKVLKFLITFRIIATTVKTTRMVPTIAANLITGHLFKIINRVVLV